MQKENIPELSNCFDVNDPCEESNDPSEEKTFDFDVKCLESIVDMIIASFEFMLESCFELLNFFKIHRVIGIDHICCHDTAKNGKDPTYRKMYSVYFSSTSRNPLI